jgi:hypothetical protein
VSRVDLSDYEPSRVNAVLTFVDETGREWLAGADMGPLCRFEGGTDAVESMEVDRMKDRAFSLSGFKIVAAAKETDQP